MVRFASYLLSNLLKYFLILNLSSKILLSFKKLFIKRIFSLKELLLLVISISSKTLELPSGITSLLSKLKISTAVNIIKVYFKDIVFI